MKIDSDIQDVLAQCYADSRKTAKVLFNSRFHRPFTKVHDRVFKLIDKKPTSPTYKPKKLIVLPRGMGKTSIANMLVPAKKALFQEAHYIVPVSASATLATQQSENLKQKLVHNNLIKGLFGDIKTRVLNKEQWIINVGGESDGFKVCIMPRGSGQQIRGMLWEDFRPDLLIVDDLEDPDNLLSEDQRKKQKDWFFGDLEQCVDNYAELGSWEILVVGTVVHQDSTIVTLMESDDWDTEVFSLCDEDLKSNVPEWASDEWVKEKYESLKEKGQVTTFYREYMNKPNAGGKDATFQTSFFQDYDVNILDTKDPELEHLVIVDPARTANTASADTAVVGVSINMRSNAWYVRDIVRGKFHYDQIISESFDMVERLRARVLGVEVTGLHEFVIYPFKNEMSRRRLSIDLIELKARTGVQEKGKIERIRHLVPYYRQGLIYHNPSCCAVLESQLISFPHSKLWDVMDALSYVPEILEIGERYMEPIDFDDYPDYETLEEEYKNIDYSHMEPTLEDFRAW